MVGFGRLYGEEEAEYVAKLVSEKQNLVREKSVKSQGILFHQVGGNLELYFNMIEIIQKWIKINLLQKNGLILAIQGERLWENVDFKHFDDSWQSLWLVLNEIKAQIQPVHVNYNKEI